MQSPQSLSRKTAVMLRALLVGIVSLVSASAYATICLNCLGSGGPNCACGVHALLGRQIAGGDLTPEELDAFRTRGVGWTRTASGTSNLGQPVELTWSVVPDGTTLPGGLGEPATPSSLVSFLDGIHHDGPGPGGLDITQRDWFDLFESSFERWDELSGINFSYEVDDGARHPSSPGILGVRGDHRIGGHPIDGQISPTFLAYNFFPNTSDMVIDTDEINRWGNPNNNFLLFRNMLMHEIGHGLGLQHVESSNAGILMGPFLATQFDGPQLDDILAVHRLYGDVNEEGVGNETYLDSTPIGRFWPGQSVSIGSDAADTFVDPTQVDFLSIDDDSDTDFFRFTVLSPGFVDLQLTPLGPTYQEGPQGGLQNPFNTSRQSDLSLTLWGADGTTILETVDDNGLGESELLEDVFLFEPGDYYVSIEGAQNAAQFYELELELSAPIPTGRNPFFNIVEDFARRAGFGRFFGGRSFPIPLASHLPEPSSATLATLAASALLVRRRTVT